MAAAALLLTACVTPYARKGWAGGYTDEKIDETHYRVRFDGNGNTSSDRVWALWLYRCAELTKEKGFTHFTVRKPGEPLAAGPDPSRGGMVKTKGGGAPIVIFTPGYTITTWHNDAVVAMFREPLPEAVMFIRAQAVLDQLGAYVHTEEKAPPLAREEVLRNAATVVRPERGYIFGGEL